MTWNFSFGTQCHLPCIRCPFGDGRHARKEARSCLESFPTNVTFRSSKIFWTGVSISLTHLALNSELNIFKCMSACMSGSWSCFSWRWNFISNFPSSNSPTTTAFALHLTPPVLWTHRKERTLFFNCSLLPSVNPLWNNWGFPKRDWRRRGCSMVGEGIFLLYVSLNESLRGEGRISGWKIIMSVGHFNC